MVEIKRYILTVALALLCGGFAAAQGRTLVHGSRFEGDLPPELLDELGRAQDAEEDVPRLVAEYRENHGRMLELLSAYERAGAQAAADSIKAQFDLAMQTGAGLDRRIGMTWETIFDSKSYAYNYLMDKNNRNDMLARFDGAMDELRQEQAQWRGVWASDAVVDYLLQKRLLTDYEIALAGETDDRPAADSLRLVSEALPRPGELERLEPVVLQEREFIDTSSKERVYRLELSGAGDISPETRETIRAAIAASPAGKGSVASNIVRSEGGFVVTPLDGATAIRMRTALQALETLDFEIKIVKNSE